MMGHKDKPQSPLFYSFSLDEVVPQDHLLRKIDRFLDRSDLRQHLASYNRLSVHLYQHINADLVAGAGFDSINDSPGKIQCCKLR
jgi:hypothetical protein